MVKLERCGNPPGVRFFFKREEMVGFGATGEAEACFCFKELGMILYDCVG